MLYAGSITRWLSNEVSSWRIAVAHGLRALTQIPAPMQVSGLLLSDASGHVAQCSPAAAAGAPHFPRCCFALFRPQNQFATFSFSKIPKSEIPKIPESFSHRRPPLPSPRPWRRFQLLRFTAMLRIGAQVFTSGPLGAEWWHSRCVWL